jgi:NADPH:quinone reductase
MNMKSYWMHVGDVPNPIELREVPIPVPGPTQALVKIHAAGLNRGEFIKGHGLHGSQGAKAIGMEGAGEITALGEKVTAATGLKLGDRVMARCAATFAEYALMDIKEMMRIPENVSYEEASCIPLTFLVTYDLLVQQGRLKANDWLLVNGVSSGVGVASLQMAKALGAKVIGTSGSQEKLNKLATIGFGLGNLYTFSQFLRSGHGHHGRQRRSTCGQHGGRFCVCRKPALLVFSRSARYCGLCRWRFECAIGH